MCPSSLKSTLLIALSGLAASSTTLRAEHDLVVYGGTSAGVVAAVQMAREGKTAIIIEPSQHVGGLTSGGLGATDSGNKGVIGGVSREFYQRLKKHYSKESSWTRENLQNFKGRAYKVDDDAIWQFEPHIAEMVYREMLAEAGIEVVYGERLNRDEGGGGVVKMGTDIASIKMESGREFTGKRFIDATYEGDLLAAAGVSYRRPRAELEVRRDPERRPDAPRGEAPVHGRHRPLREEG